MQKENWLMTVIVMLSFAALIANQSSDSSSIWSRRKKISFMEDATCQFTIKAEVELYEVDEIAKPAKQFVFIRQICEDIQIKCSTALLFDYVIERASQLPNNRKTEMRI